MGKEDYKLLIEDKNKYLLARTSGVRTFNTVKAMTMEIFDAALAAHRSKVLIDVSELEGRLGVLDSYRMVTEVFQALHGKGIRTAAGLASFRDDRLVRGSDKVIRSCSMSSFFTTIPTTSLLGYFHNNHS